MPLHELEAYLDWLDALHAAPSITSSYTRRIFSMRRPKP
jgi:hypothetical protein